MRDFERDALADNSGELTDSQIREIQNYLPADVHTVVC